MVDAMGQLVQHARQVLRAHCCWHGSHLTLLKGRMHVL